MSLITVIGRGHSGTRAMSHTLSESGVFMGDKLNKSGDLLPPDDLYEACRVMAEHVDYRGDYEWDFSRVLEGPIDPEFKQLVTSYLEPVLESEAEHRGWKLPETTLVYPWILRMFPEARYILWFRDPRDSILGAHLTDDLSDFGVPYEKTDCEYKNRAVSWLYQWKLVKATPTPQHSLVVRFEDFVLNQEETLKKLEDFLGFELAAIPVKKEPVGRWKRREMEFDFPFLEQAMEELDYR